MISRRAISLFATLAATGMLLAFSVNAAGAQYPPNTPVLTPDPPVVSPGDPIEVCGSGFDADTDVTVTVGVDGTQTGVLDGTTDSEGNFCVSDTAPDSPGSTIEYEADDGNNTATTTVTIIDVAGPTDDNDDATTPPLAFTGRSTGTTVMFGAIVIAIGAVAVALGRGRATVTA